MLCTCPVRSVGSLSRTCFRDFRLISDVQVFILHGLPRGRRTHGERISAKIDTTQCYSHWGQPVPAVVPITVVASGYLPRRVLYIFTAYGHLFRCVLNFSPLSSPLFLMPFISSRTKEVSGCSLTIVVDCLCKASFILLLCLPLACFNFLLRFCGFLICFCNFWICLSRSAFWSCEDTLA